LVIRSGTPLPEQRLKEARWGAVAFRLLRVAGFAMCRSDRWGPSTCRSAAGVTERAGRAALRSRLAVSAATAFDSFASPKELAELVAGWPAERLVAVCNSLPGVTPVKPVQGPDDGGHPDWKSIQDLDEAAKPKAAQPVQPKAEHKAKGGNAKATQKASPAKNAPKGKRAAKTQQATTPHEGSKTAQVVAMPPAEERSHSGP
jgi:hypothetical protein